MHTSVPRRLTNYHGSFLAFAAVKKGHPIVINPVIKDDRRTCRKEMARRDASLSSGAAGFLPVARTSSQSEAEIGDFVAVAASPIKSLSPSFRQSGSGNLW
jgi:hypothetical protein